MKSPRRAKNYSILMSIFSALLFIFIQSLSGQSVTANQHVNIPGKHLGAVTAIARDEMGRTLSVGKDGFLETWSSQSATERLQLSPYGIETVVLRPGNSQAAIVESDGIGMYRVSAWDYDKKQKLFTLGFSDSVTFIAYSAAGSFLIVARSGKAGVLFIDSQTGELLETPADLTGTVTFAATGRSERVMICYLLTGILSYWDLETGSELQHFEVSPNIRSPVLFGNNRFFGGFDTQGLLIIDAVTGSILARDNSINQGVIFADSPGTGDTSGSSARFNCLSFTPGAAAVLRMEISLAGRLNTSGRRTVPSAAGEVTCGATSDGENIYLGTGQGEVWLLGRNNSHALATGNPGRIMDIAASSSAIGFITEEGSLGFIPLDYTQIRNNDSFLFENAAAYTNIASQIQENIRPIHNIESRFILWHSGAGRTTPVIKTLRGQPKDSDTSELLLERLSSRSLRAVSLFNDRVLLLDTAGFVTVLNGAGNILYSQNAAGSVDAAFINEHTIILGRSTAAGNTPFFSVDINTGETVPLAYPAVVGIKAYRGQSGFVYGAAISQSGGSIQTSIIRLNTISPARSQKLIEFGGEDSFFSMAESGGNLATSLGGSGAVIYVDNPAGGNRNNTGNPYSEIIPVERSPGLPQKIINGLVWFIILDGEGNIAWHDNQTGELLAVFSLYRQDFRDYWVLEKKNRLSSTAEIITGPANK